MNSVIYEGFVEHIRHRPVRHRLLYALYVYALDLDELSVLDKSLPLFGYNRFRPSAIYDADYLDASPGTLREKLLRFLAREGENGDIGRVILITSARYFNYVFNPVSFYYCYRTDGTRACIVAEVNNTFGERHVYIPRTETGGDEAARYYADKAFHVSPFNDMTGTYEFHFAPLTDDLDIRINLMKDSELFFEARLRGRAVPLTAATHRRVLLRHPLMPHLTIPRIVWEAVKLHFRRKLPVYTKPEAVSLMTIRKKARKGQKSPPLTGTVDGLLYPCGRKPSCVSSTSTDRARYVGPLAYTADGETARDTLLRTLAALPRTHIVTADENYIHAECRSFLFRFVDDVEFLIEDGRKRIQIRSASRVGYYDFGVNRRRIEDIRHGFADRLKERKGGTP